VRSLSPHQFNHRLETAIARLDRIGALTVRDRGGDTPVRKLIFDLVIPGLQALGVPDEAHFRYEEWFRRRESGEWERVRYDYNYRDLVRGGLLGYHLHPLVRSDNEPVSHMKVVQADGSGEGHHYAAYEIEILDAHERLETVFAQGEPISNRGLRRID